MMAYRILSALVVCAITVSLAACGEPQAGDGLALGDGTSEPSNCDAPGIEECPGLEEVPCQFLEDIEAAGASCMAIAAEFSRGENRAPIIAQQLLYWGWGGGPYYGDVDQDSVWNNSRHERRIHCDDDGYEQVTVDTDLETGSVNYFGITMSRTSLGFQIEYLFTGDYNSDELVELSPDCAVYRSSGTSIPGDTWSSSYADGVLSGVFDWYASDYISYPDHSREEYSFVAADGRVEGDYDHYNFDEGDLIQHRSEHEIVTIDGNRECTRVDWSCPVDVRNDCWTASGTDERCQDAM